MGSGLGDRGPSRRTAEARDRGDRVVMVFTLDKVLGRYDRAINVSCGGRTR